MNNFNEELSTVRASRALYIFTDIAAVHSEFFTYDEYIHVESHTFDYQIPYKAAPAITQGLSNHFHCC